MLEQMGGSLLLAEGGSFLLSVDTWTPGGPLLDPFRPPVDPQVDPQVDPSLVDPQVNPQVLSARQKQSTSALENRTGA